MINCPKCNSEKLVETPALGNIPLDVCPGCSGIWFDKGELEALLAKSQGSPAGSLDFLNPKESSMNCPRCGKSMSRGGLVNPLLLVDKCEACGGVWLDPNELGLVKKLLGLSGGPSDVKVERAAAAPEAPAASGPGSLVKAFAAVAALAGLAGLSFELYLYFSPTEAVTYTPSAGLTALSVLFFAGGAFGLGRK